MVVVRRRGWAEGGGGGSGLMLGGRSGCEEVFRGLGWFAGRVGDCGLFLYACGARVKVSGWVFEWSLTLWYHVFESLFNSANECIECCCSPWVSNEAPCLNT